MNISSASASAASLTYAQKPSQMALQLRAAAKQAADTRKALIETDKAKAMDTPVFKGAESKKQQAKAKIQQIMEWLKIARKLYAMDPKGMAKALAQVFKDLKSAVKAYKDAGGDEMSASGAAAGAVIGAGAPEQPANSKAEGEGKPAEAEPAAEAADAEAKTAPTDQAPAQAAEAAGGGAGLYQAVVGEIRKAVGEDGLEFVKTVRETVNEIVKLLDTARGQAAVRKRDKETDKSFEDASEALKDLREEVDTMEADIRREAPTAGMKLSVAA